MNLKAVHFVVIFLGALVGACNAVAASSPQYMPLCHAVATMSASMAATLGILCQPPKAPDAPTQAPAAPPPAAAPPAPPAAA